MYECVKQYYSILHDQYVHKKNKYLRETGCPTEAPCMRSLRRFTRRLVVFSPITKLIASMKFDFPKLKQNQRQNITKLLNIVSRYIPEPLGPMTAVKFFKGPII